MEQHTFDMLTVAQSYVASGLSLIPTRRGEKEPAFDLLPRAYDEADGKNKPTWKPYQDRLPNQGELRHWFASGDANMAIVCGKVSGGLVGLDIESVALYERWRELAAHLVGDALLDTLPLVASGKGRHIYFRMDTPPRNSRLAMRDRELLAEARGEGGTITAPPSVHSSGKVYTLLNGDLRAVPLLDLGTAEALLDAARALAPVQEHPIQAVKTEGGGSPREGESVIDAYNRRHRIEEVLEAHRYTRERSGRYVRPDGERSSIIIRDGRSIHYNPADPLYSEAPGGGQHAHTPFSAFCILDHNGDVRAAVRPAASELGMAHDAGGASSPSPEALAKAGRALGLGEETGGTWPYFVHEGGLWMHQQHSDGSPKPPLLLGNFTAEITAERVLDDGEQRDELYTITAVCQGRQRTLELKRTEFESEAALARIVAALGARARLNPRAQNRFVLDAIKALSSAVREEVRFAHTGWVERRFLFANGYVDADGWHEAGDCQLPRRLQQYRLNPPAAPSGEALNLFDSLLAVAPSVAVVPLLGGVLLGPLLASVDAPAPMVHLYGPTGSHKTSIACAALALFGDFTPSQPTDTWTSTANSGQRAGLSASRRRPSRRSSSRTVCFSTPARLTTP